MNQRKSQSEILEEYVSSSDASAEYDFVFYIVGIFVCVYLYIFYKMPHLIYASTLGETIIKNAIVIPIALLLSFMALVVGRFLKMLFLWLFKKIAFSNRPILNIVLLVVVLILVISFITYISF